MNINTEEKWVKSRPFLYTALNIVPIAKFAINTFTFTINTFYLLNIWCI